MKPDSNTKARKRKSPTLLCVANGRATTGYAWDYINGLYADLGCRAVERGMRAMVAFRNLNAEPRHLAGTAVRPVELRAHLRSIGGLIETAKFIWKERVRVLYLSDRRVRDPAYLLLRLAGVKRIVVHIHTAQIGEPAKGWRRLLKLATHRLPGATADEAVAVSGFVARRVAEVAEIPVKTVHRMWNSITPAEISQQDAKERLRHALGIDTGRLIIGCSARAMEYKGIPDLLRAFDKVAALPGLRPVLVYFGDGPDLEQWRTLVNQLPSRQSIIMAGYRRDAPTLMGGVDVAVMPSTCDEGFGIAALEPMSFGIPVIATRVGGLVEVVQDEVTGILVPPGNVDALAGALSYLLANGTERARMGAAGKRRCLSFFARDASLDKLESLVLGDTGLAP